MKTKHTIITGNSVSKLDKIESHSISSVITSPPYNIGKDYGEYKDKVDRNNWEELIFNILNKSKRVLKPNGSFFLNVSPIPDKKTKEIIPLDAVCYGIGKEAGYYLRNSIIWNFNNMQNPTKRLSGRWESILWFVKDIDNYIFNLDDIRIPYITKNDKRLSPTGGRNPTDVWYFDRVNNMTKKKIGLSEVPTMFPTPMIERIIKMSTKKGDIVLDPFAGSGTTALAAKNLSRNSVSIEIDKKYKEIILKRLKLEHEPK